MKDLEDTKCEVRKIIDLQFPICDSLNASAEEERVQSSGSSGFDARARSLGNFFEDPVYAWLSCGPRLVVINVKTGTSIGSWTFRDHVTCVSEFPTQRGEIPLLLVGLDNGASKIRDSVGLVCIFDCTSSRVLRAIRMPAGVEQACVVIGGAEWEDFGDRRMDDVLGENSGMACIALRNLDHLMVDLRRGSWDGPDSTILMDETNPAELLLTETNETVRHRSSREKHAAYNLMYTRLEQYIGFNREEFESSTIYQESLTSSLICSRKIGCLVSGCLGRIIIWQTDGAVRWISKSLDENNMSITHLALLEPTDDPRPFCYLWSAHQEETCRSPPILRMYAMLFERKYTDKGTNAYFNLESDPSVKFELELNENARITSLRSIVRESNPEQTDSMSKRGEDSILLISMENRVIVFDLNQWYKEQMPRMIVECDNPNAIIASYRTRPETLGINANDETIVNSTYIPETLKEFPSNGSSPPEELFFPNSLSLEWCDLSNNRLTFWLVRGVQADLLREISLTGPVIMIEPTETFERCSSNGLVPSHCELTKNPDQDAQREILLSLCLEQRWSGFLLKCVKEWSDGSASYLFHAFLRWAMQRASSIKLQADRLSVALYDQSGTVIGDTEIRTLRFYSQQLECIASVLTNLTIEQVDLTTEKRALRRVSTYLQVLLWFYDVGLLPEFQEFEDENSTPISFSLKIPYPCEKLATIYREKRHEFATKSTKNVNLKEEDMFIDEHVGRECSALKSQWEREGGGESSYGGSYPPSSLQSLLRSYLTDCHDDSSESEIEKKHQITIYLLMDLAMLLQNTCPGVDQLIKYPSAFKLSPSLIKLTQALWLLDHEDYHGFLDMMTGQLVSDTDVQDWHHRLVLRTLVRNNQNKLALIYLRVRKPPLSSLDDQSTVITLSVEHGLVQSAFHRRPPSHYDQLLTSFFRACTKHGKLNDILHLALDSDEEEAFVKFLENEGTEETRLLYYLQRCRYAEAGKVYPIAQSSSARQNYTRNNEKSASVTILNAYNSTLPDITRKFSSYIGRRVTDNDLAASRYPRPMSHCDNRGKTRDIHENVLKKARETYTRCDRSRIPFVSAPCATLRSQAGNVDTNRVLFVDRAKRKSNGKRTYDEMRDNNERQTVDIDVDSQKRRKLSINADNTSATWREIGAGTIFDTPLVKRKNHSINVIGEPIETPHSILKIRQLIRDSTSPSSYTVKTTSRETIIEDCAVANSDRDRKPRQIRFSIGQPRNEESSITEDNDDNEESEKNPADGEVDDESEDTVKSHGKVLISEEEVDDVEIRKNANEQDDYSSSSISEKTSYYDETMLSDTSIIGRNVSGPRPRPSLRRSCEPGDLLKKTLMRANASSRLSQTPMSKVSEKSVCEDSLNDDREINGPPSTQEKLSLSRTLYSPSILSPDTSLEYTPSFGRVKSGLTMDRNDRSFAEKTLEKCRDVMVNPVDSERSDNFSKFDRVFEERRITTRTRTNEESIGDPEEDTNSEVLMELDRYGLDRDSSTRSPTKLENASKIDNHEEDEREIFAITTMHSVTETMVIETAEYLTERQPAESRKIEHPVGEERQIISLDQKADNSRDKEVDNWMQRDTDDSNDEGTKNPVEQRENDDEDKSPEEEESEVGGNYEETEDDEVQDYVEIDSADNWTEVPSSPMNSVNQEIVINEMEIVTQPDDYDEELLDLRYEEDAESSENSGEDDNSDVYQSLSNSMNVEHASMKLSFEKSILASEEAEGEQIEGNHEESEELEALRKSAYVKNNDDFYELARNIDHEIDITDDESSRSVDGSAAIVDTTSTGNDPDKTLTSEEPRIIDDASNITNDESTSSFDSSLFSVKKTSKVTEKLDNAEGIANDSESSQDSSLFTREKRKNDDSPETVKKQLENEDPRQILSNLEGSFTSRVIERDIDTITSYSVNRSETESKESKDKMPKARRGKSKILEKESLGMPKRSKSPTSETDISTSLRMTRSRRATSVVQEQSAAVESSLARENKTGRSRRATSLAKDIFTSTPPTDVATTKDNEKSSSRMKISNSLVNDVRSRDIEITPINQDEEAPIGRRTRRATSVQKDTTATTATTIVTRSSSKISLSEESADDTNVSRKTTRAKRATTSTSKETSELDVPKRKTRASSLAKETSEENEDPSVTLTDKRTTRKRGTSVPKEMSTRAASLRTRRGGSVVKDVSTTYMSDDNAEETKPAARGGSSARELRNVMDRTSPTTSGRNRLSSITSIPEENDGEEERTRKKRTKPKKQDENEVDSDDEIFAWRGKSSEGKKMPRERRAMSVDLPRTVVTRRTRATSARSAIIDEPIEEETTESALMNERKTKTIKRAPVRRKRTVSSASVNDEDEVFLVEPRRSVRTRTLSQRSNESETFQFSPPDKAHDRPDNNGKEIGQVPAYDFSSPYTKSRRDAIPPRRKMKEFVPATEKQKQAGRRYAEGFINRPRISLSGLTRDPFILYGPIKQFVITKRIKNASSVESKKRDPEIHR